MADASRKGRGRLPNVVLLAVSDATGSTARSVLEAALAQYPDVVADIRQIGGVRTIEQAEAAVVTASQSGAALVHTLVQPEVRDALDAAARARGVVGVDLLGPLLTHLQRVIGMPPSARAGAVQGEPTERAAAMNFTVKHDDGQRPGDLTAADVVLVGPSRTSKTPLSVYLSYYGWRVANVPILLHVAPPDALFSVEADRVIGLSATAADLLARRRARVQRLEVDLPEYTDPRTVRQELALLADLCRRRGWRVVSVSNRSIEDTAVEIIDLLGDRTPGTL